MCEKKQFWLHRYFKVYWQLLGFALVVMLWDAIVFVCVGLLPKISQVWPVQEHAGQSYCPPGDKEKVKTHIHRHFYSLLLYQFSNHALFRPFSPSSQRVPLHETPAALQPLPCSGCHPGGRRTGQGGRASRYQLCRRLQCLTPGPKKKNNVSAPSPPLSLLITIVTTQGALLCFFLSSPTVCVKARASLTPLYLATARVLTFERPLRAHLRGITSYSQSTSSEQQRGEKKELLVMLLQHLMLRSHAASAPRLSPRSLSCCSCVLIPDTKSTFLPFL